MLLSGFSLSQMTENLMFVNFSYLPSLNVIYYLISNDKLKTNKPQLAYILEITEFKIHVLSFSCTFKSLVGFFFNWLHSNKNLNPHFVHYKTI